MLKGKVLFNSVYTTVEKRKSNIILKDDAVDGYVLPWQKVIAVGPHVENIKVGDTVLINIEKFKDRLPGVEIKDNMYLALTERDIMYIYDESEVPEETELPS